MIFQYFLNIFLKLKIIKKLIIIFLINKKKLKCKKCPSGKKVYIEDESGTFCYDNCPNITFIKPNDNERCYSTICPGIQYANISKADGVCYYCI